MGTDIHGYAEVRRRGAWEKVGAVFPYHWFDPTFPESEQNPRLTDEFFTERNYNLFAILADVRNDHGAFVPIDTPRGLPDDLSVEMRAIVAARRDRPHDESYLTLAELLAFDWDGWQTPYRGVIPEREWEHYRKYGRPRHWLPAIIEGPPIVVLDEPDYMALRLHPALHDRSKNYFIRAAWTESYADAVAPFITQVLGKLVLLGKPEDVRIVFWFS